MGVTLEAVYTIIGNNDEEVSAPILQHIFGHAPVGPGKGRTVYIELAQMPEVVARLGGAKHRGHSWCINRITEYGLVFYLLYSGGDDAREAEILLPWSNVLAIHDINPRFPEREPDTL